MLSYHSLDSEATSRTKTLRMADFGFLKPKGVCTIPLRIDQKSTTRFAFWVAFYPTRPRDAAIQATE